VSRRDRKPEVPGVTTEIAVQILPLDLEISPPGPPRDDLGPVTSLEEKPAVPLLGICQGLNSINWDVSQ
jgi:hypothetical protein